MAILNRWLAPAALAVGLGFGAMTPAPVQAQDAPNRVLVDVADVVVRGGQPYYRYGDYGADDRLAAERDRYGREAYYRTVRRHDDNYRSGPPYGNAYGYYRNAADRNVKCNKHGKCKASYYDSRHDDRADYDRYHNTRDNRYGRTDDRYWDGRRWRDRNDD